MRQAAAPVAPAPYERLSGGLRYDGRSLQGLLHAWALASSSNDGTVGLLLRSPRQLLSDAATQSESALHGLIVRSRRDRPRGVTLRPLEHMECSSSRVLSYVGNELNRRRNVRDVRLEDFRDNGASGAVRQPRTLVPRVRTQGLRRSPQWPEGRRGRCRGQRHRFDAPPPGSTSADHGLTAMDSARLESAPYAPLRQRSQATSTCRFWPRCSRL